MSSKPNSTGMLKTGAFATPISNPRRLSSTARSNDHIERMSRSSIRLLTYTDDVDLRARLSEGEQFYNLPRPHGAQRKSALRDPPRTAIIDARMSHKCVYITFPR